MKRQNRRVTGCAEAWAGIASIVRRAGFALVLAAASLLAACASRTPSVQAALGAGPTSQAQSEPFTPVLKRS